MSPPGKNQNQTTLDQAVKAQDDSKFQQDQLAQQRKGEEDKNIQSYTFSSTLKNAWQYMTNAKARQEMNERRDAQKAADEAHNEYNKNLQGYLTDKLSGVYVSDSKYPGDFHGKFDLTNPKDVTDKFKELMSATAASVKPYNEYANAAEAKQVADRAFSTTALFDHAKWQAQDELNGGAFRTNPPTSERKKELEGLIQELNKMQVKDRVECSAKGVPHSNSLEIMAQYASDKNNKMDEKSALDPNSKPITLIEDFQRQIANELDKRIGNEKYPLNAISEIATIKMLQDLQTRIDKLPDGPDKEQMLEANKNLGQTLGVDLKNEEAVKLQILEKYDNYLSSDKQVDAGRTDLDIIKNIQQELADNPDASPAERKMQEKLLDSMDKRLAKEQERSMKALENPKMEQSTKKAMGYEQRAEDVAKARSNCSELKNQLEDKKRAEHTSESRPSTPRPSSPTK